MAARDPSVAGIRDLVAVALLAVLAVAAVPAPGQPPAPVARQRILDTLTEVLRRAGEAARLQPSPVTVRLQTGSPQVSLSSADGMLHRVYTLEGAVATSDAVLTVLPSGTVMGAGPLHLRVTAADGPVRGQLAVSAAGRLRQLP